MSRRQKDASNVVQAFFCGALVCIFVVILLFRGENMASASVTDLVATCAIELFGTVGIAFFAVRNFEKKRGVFETAEYFVENIKDEIDAVCEQLSDDVKEKRKTTHEVAVKMRNVCDMVNGLRSMLISAGFHKETADCVKKIEKRIFDCNEWCSAIVSRKGMSINEKRELVDELFKVKVDLISLLGKMHKY